MRFALAAGIAPSSGSALLGAALALASLSLVPRLARRLAPERKALLPPWGFGHLALAVLAGVVCAGAVAVLAPGAPETGLIGIMWRGAAISFGAALAIAAIVVRVAPDGLASLGLCSSRNLGAAASALAVWALALPGLWGLGLAWPWVLERLGVPIEPPLLLESLAAARGPALWIAVLLAVVVIPFLEEVCFRGFLQPLLVRRWGGACGVLVTSVLFASLHGWSAFGPVLGLSLILGAVMLRTRRLSAPFVVHAANNGLAILMLRILPELTPP